MILFYSEFENLEALKNFQNHSLHEAHKSVVGILFVSVYVEILKDENRTYIEVVDYDSKVGK